jgi:septal ring factor EnvC (AmiA/AmiB activator)
VTQTEPKLFRIARTAGTTWRWKVASAALSLIAVGAGVFGYVQYNTVRTLNARLAEARAEANQAAAEGAELRSQLSAARDRINSQATKLTATTQEVDTEQQQLAATEQQVNQEQHQLAAAERQVADEKRQLQDAHTQLAAQSRPDLPVRVLFVDAARAGAKAVVLRNLSDTELDVTLDVQSPGSNAHARKQLVLAARGVLRMGPAQGWEFTPGQVVTLDNAKFRRIVQTVS